MICKIGNRKNKILMCWKIYILPFYISYPSYLPFLLSSVLPQNHRYLPFLHIFCFLPFLLYIVSDLQLFCSTHFLLSTFPLSTFSALHLSALQIFCSTSFLISTFSAQNLFYSAPLLLYTFSALHLFCFTYFLCYIFLAHHIF